jgi:hypothetical protein
VLRKRQAELDDRVATSIWTFKCVASRRTVPQGHTDRRAPRPVSGDGKVAEPAGSEPAESSRARYVCSEHDSSDEPDADCLQVSNRTLALLLEPLAAHLPAFPSSPLKLYFNTDDLPARSALHSVVSRSRNLAREGELWPDDQRLAQEEQQTAEPGWDYACPAGARFLKQPAVQPAEEGERPGGGASRRRLGATCGSPSADPSFPSTDKRPKAFVYDQDKTSDVCRNDRSLLQSHGTLIQGRPHAVRRLASPTVGKRVHCRT